MYELAIGESLFIFVGERLFIFMLILVDQAIC